MRTSRYLLATLKETPGDAEIVSHQLMVRAGLIRRLAAGIYSWLPLGLRVLRKVEDIVREEMDRSGAHEVLMPAIQPAELWQASGRWTEYGPELLRLRDRHQREFCFGPTHEEVITSLIRNEVRSYRQLPANFYQIQWKFRDEVRPRFGVMRAREFLMKDAYSFDVDLEGLRRVYRVMYETYGRIFERCGLAYCAVAAHSGPIGGSTSHEFHVLADSGEDAIAMCPEHDYAANVELVPLPAPAQARPTASQSMQVVDTPGQHTIEALSAFLGVAPERTLKTLIVHGHDDGLVALALRGDHELNAVKAARHAAVAEPLRFASAEEIRAALGVDVGSLGPVGLRIALIVDQDAAVMADFVCGANEAERHLTGVNWGRDLPEPEVADLRKAVEGDPCPPDDEGRPRLGTLVVRRGIEVGHVFQLGTKYSEPLEATCLDENGNSAVMHMGCYGIGVSRIVAAAIEQNHDSRGIIWPEPIAPFQVCIVAIGYGKSPEVAAAAESVYKSLSQAGIEVLLDDRDERAGVMFADMDLIGIPHRLVLSARGVANGTAEYKGRRMQESRDLPLDGLVDTLRELRGEGV